jgi:hypothetical protein
MMDSKAVAIELMKLGFETPKINFSEGDVPSMKDAQDERIDLLIDTYTNILNKLEKQLS